MYQSIPIENRIIRPTKTKKKILVFVGILVFIVFLVSGYIWYLCQPITMATESTQLEVSKGMTVRSIAKKAEELGIVRSHVLLYLLLSYANNPSGIYAGMYEFSGAQTPFAVAEKLSSNDIEKSALRITIPEGSTRKDIATIASQVIPSFDTTYFMEHTTTKEGYLFPDTYFVAPDFSAQQLIDLLSQTYTEKTTTTFGTLQTATLSENQIIILASILEKEANDITSMRMVSGILQNRLKANIPLQTDATVGYELNKTLKDLTEADLEVDTPYNTYKYKGLPPTAIGNPGLGAIDAVLHPTVTDNMFYITGKDGVFYYAKTFEEHKRNIAKHL